MAIRKLNIDDIVHKAFLYCDPIVPSHSHAYSVCVQYVRDWILKKFPQNFFPKESIYVDGSHIFSEMSTLTRAQLLKRLTPNLVVVPELDYQYTNENIDLNQTKLKTYIKRSGFDGAFFIDYDTSMRIGINFEIIKMNTTYRIKVKTRNQQLDIYQRLKLVLGQTSGEYISTDVHVPFELMMQVAINAGFEVDSANKKIYDIDKFLRYLNMHSIVPFIYKLRYVNGREEFFLRLNDFYIHTRVNDISIDSGERIGQLNSNFTIEISTEVRFPAPQIYILYSLTENKLLTSMGDIEYDALMFIDTIRLGAIPNTNDRGWNKHIETDIVEDNLQTFIDINFSPIFEKSDMERVINYTKSVGISPAAFMDIKIFNDGRGLDINIDWQTLNVTAKELHKDPVSKAVIYIDMDYVNSTLVVLNKANESRLG